ncbi:GNAT family N-acetyltransferase, partial [Bacillus cereus]
MMGIHIRRAIKDDIQGIAKVHVDSWKTAYKGIFADEILDNIA